MIMTYSDQRKSRMQDAIDDYLTDGEVSSRDTYDEMMSCIDDVIKYHKPVSYTHLTLPTKA